MAINISHEVLYYQYIKTIYGELILAEFAGNIVLCDWRYRKMRATIDKRIKKGSVSAWIEQDTELLMELKYQIKDYSEGKRKQFSVPYCPIGTDFQKEVWKKLQEIPYGETLTYTNLATRMGSFKAVRAVASANGANALSLIIPCHRVVGSNNELVGYAGGLAAKRELLSLEGIQQGWLFDGLTK